MNIKKIFRKAIIRQKEEPEKKCYIYVRVGMGNYFTATIELDSGKILEENGRNRENPETTENVAFCIAETHNKESKTVGEHFAKRIKSHPATDVFILETLKNVRQLLQELKRTENDN